MQPGCAASFVPDPLWQGVAASSAETRPSSLSCSRWSTMVFPCFTPRASAISASVLPSLKRARVASMVGTFGCGLGTLARLPRAVAASASVRPARFRPARARSRAAYASDALRAPSRRTLPPPRPRTTRGTPRPCVRDRRMHFERALVQPEQREPRERAHARERHISLSVLERIAQVYERAVQRPCPGSCAR